MKTKTIISALVLSALAISFFASITYAQQERKIKMEDYQAMMAEYQQREAAAKAKLDECNSKKDGQNQKLADLDSQIKSEWDEIYALLGTDAAGVAAYRQALADLERQVDGLDRLSSEELFRRKDEIKESEAKLEEHKTSRIYALSEMRDRVATIEGKITRLKGKLPKSLYDDYNVVRGDYLWKISKKPDIYDDPMQWMKIYTYNRDMIKDPDLIYPDWVLKIPRQVGPNEYIVMKGEYLNKIASSQYGDPTHWTKLYEANKDVISDPNTIYPYQILVIPRD